MTNYFKMLWVCVLLACTTVHSQVQTLDKLIAEVDNSEAYLVMLQTVSPRIHSEAGQQIIGLGKKVTPQLIQVLDNENKGIIAHFILSEIWKEKWDQAQYCDVLTDGVVEIVIVNGLEIQIKDNHLSSKMEDLKKNKARWKTIAAS